MHCGWTVWERVVLYNSIYAADNGMLPVVDMKYYPSIYQEEHENVWEVFYEQPCGVSLEDAYCSNDYLLSDMSEEWFGFIRKRYFFSKEYLRKNYSRFIRVNDKTKKILKDKFFDITRLNYNDGLRMIGICMRGTDYRIYNHPVQPEIENIIKLAKRKYIEYNCDAYYIATEDRQIYEKLIERLEGEKVFNFNAGEVEECEGYIGQQLMKKKSGHKNAIDYMTILYMLKQCVCLVGGECGATIVSQYATEKPYEYINIFRSLKKYKNRN